MSLTSPPLISIVLPTFNGKKHLKDSLLSCLNQSYKNIEIIVVNDASTDDSLDLINKIAATDSRIKVVTNKENLKLPKSLNVGFELAKGEYLTWTSDDNSFRTESLNELVKFLENNSDIDFVYSNYTLINDESMTLKTVDLPPPSQMPLGNVVGPSFLFTRKAFETTGYFDTQLFLIEDYDYWVRVFKKFKMVKIPLDLYFYRVHEKSLSSVYKNKLDKSMALFRLKHFDLFGYLETKAEKYEFLNGIHNGLSGIDLIYFHFKIFFQWPTFSYLFLKSLIKKIIRKIVKG